MKQALINGKIYIEKGMFEEAILIEEDKILKTGSNGEILASVGADCKVYDCGGKTVLPGLNDSHLHLLQVGMMLNMAPIDKSRSIEHMIEICKTYMKENPERVKKSLHALGWNQELFTEGEKRMPTRYDLDHISTEIPIVLERICGHAVSVNSRILEMAGITSENHCFEGGEFLLDECGEPNGICTENAAEYIKTFLPAKETQEIEQDLLAAMKYCVEHGITSVQSNDVGNSFGEPEQLNHILQSIYHDGKALLRYHSQATYRSIPEFEAFLENDWKNNRCGHDSWLTQGTLKLFKDGSLGAKTAMMKNGYIDEKDNHGVDCLPKEELEKMCVLASQHGVQVAVHCIGDKAIEETIDCFEKGFIDKKNKLRHAIVHCQITDKNLLDRIIKEDISVLAQPVFIDFDMNIVESLCGKELEETSYAFGTLLKNGVHLSYGTDSPVEDCNPFDNIYMAVTRKNRAGKPEGGYNPKECVDIETAIDAYTMESAYNQFQEDKKGRLKPGYDADLTVIDRDIFTCDKSEIRNILPVLTMTGGKIVYQKY